MAFRNKPSKLKYLTNVTTLDELHKNHLAKFKKNTHSLPEKKQRIAELYNQLDSLNGVPNAVKLKSNIKSEIKQLEHEITKISNNSDILEYTSKTLDLLVNYYNITSGVYYNVDDTKKSNIDVNNLDDDFIDFSDIEQSTIKPVNDDENSLMISDELKLLNQQSQKTRKVKKPVKKRRFVQDTPSGKSILQFLPVEQKKDDKKDNIILNRATLQDKYLMMVDKEYACDKSRVETIVYCTKCNIEKILIQSEGRYVCKKCGETEIKVIENETPNHKELSTEKQKYPYKKKNHLKEKLNQFQSKESADVPNNICNIIRNDLRKMRINDEKCTPPIIRKILKKHRLTSYYEHLQQIYCKISKKDPVTLSRDTEEKILLMFEMMQESFHNHCPEDRSNFLSYSYVLNKLFRILRMEEHASYFGLLKSKEKLRDQDLIWKEICKDMGWEFHSSF